MRRRSPSGHTVPDKQTLLVGEKQVKGECPDPVLEEGDHRGTTPRGKAASDGLAGFPASVLFKDLFFDTETEKELEKRRSRHCSATITCALLCTAPCMMWDLLVVEGSFAMFCIVTSLQIGFCAFAEKFNPWLLRCWCTVCFALIVGGFKDPTSRLEVLVAFWCLMGGGLVKRINPHFYCTAFELVLLLLLDSCWVPSFLTVSCGNAILSNQLITAAVFSLAISYSFEREQRLVLLHQMEGSVLLSQLDRFGSDAHDGIMLVSGPQSTIRFASTSASKLFKNNIAVLHSSSLYTWIHSRSRSALRSAEYSVDTSGISCALEVTPVDDEDAVLEISISRTSGGRMLVIRDVQERMREHNLLIKEREAKARAEAAREAEATFTAFVFHELRNPLNGLLGHLELIRRQVSSFDFREHEEVDDGSLHGDLAAAATCGDHLRRLIDNILDISRIEAGKYTVKTEPLNISSLCNQVRTILKPTVHAGVQFHVKLPAEMPGIMSDRQMLLQILINLGSNCLKFTHAGQVQLNVVVTSQPHADQATVTFQICDTGCGIPVEKQGSMFKKYERTSTKAVGTGLGLVISQKLANCLGSHISLKSPWQEGRSGTMFTFSLECATCLSPALKPQAALQDFPVDLPRGVRVLAVDDNALCLKVLVRLLQTGPFQDRDWHILQATSGEQALQVLNVPPKDGDSGTKWEPGVDVVILDQHMERSGGMLTGAQVSKLIRDAEALFHSPRRLIIGLQTGNTDSHSLLEYEGHGLDFVWGKPLPSTQFMASQLLSFLEQQNTTGS